MVHLVSIVQNRDLHPTVVHRCPREVLPSKEAKDAIDVAYATILPRMAAYVWGFYKKAQMDLFSFDKASRAFQAIEKERCTEGRAG